MIQPPELRPVFQQFIETHGHEGLIGNVAHLLADGDLDPQRMQVLLSREGAGNAVWLRKDLLDLILLYIQVVLQTRTFDDREEEVVHWLKKVFRVREGEFFSLRAAELAALFAAEMEHMLHDYEIDVTEELQQVRLPRTCDLSYDQYLALNRSTLERVVGDLEALVGAPWGVTDEEAQLRRTQLASLLPIQRLASKQSRSLGARF